MMCLIIIIGSLTIMAAVTKGTKVFETDLDVCPQCGTVLPLPGMEDVVTCKLCGFQIDVTGIDIAGLQTRKG